MPASQNSEERDTALKWKGEEMTKVLNSFTWHRKIDMDQTALHLLMSIKTKEEK